MKQWLILCNCCIISNIQSCTKVFYFIHCTKSSTGAQNVIKFFLFISLYDLIAQSVRYLKMVNQYHTISSCYQTRGNLLSLLLRCGTRSYEWGIQWDSNSLVKVCWLLNSYYFCFQWELNFKKNCYSKFEYSVTTPRFVVKTKEVTDCFSFWPVTFMTRGASSDEADIFIWVIEWCHLR